MGGSESDDDAALIGGVVVALVLVIIVVAIVISKRSSDAPSTKDSSSSRPDIQQGPSSGALSFENPLYDAKDKDANDSSDGYYDDENIDINNNMYDDLETDSAA